MGNRHSHRDALSAADIRTTLLGHRRVVDPLEEYHVESFYYRPPPPVHESSPVAGSDTSSLAGWVRSFLAGFWEGIKLLLGHIFTCNMLFTVGGFCLIALIIWFHWAPFGPRHPMARNVSLLDDWKKPSLLE